MSSGSHKHQKHPVVAVQPNKKPNQSMPAELGQEIEEKKGDQILAKLEEIIQQAKTARVKSRTKYWQSFRQFEDIVSEYRNLLKDSLNDPYLREDELTEIVRVADKHSLMRPNQLERWLRYKKSEMEVIKMIDLASGIQLTGRTGLFEVLSEIRSCNLTETLLLLHITPLNVWTKQASKEMKRDVEKFAVNGSLDSEDALDSIEEQDEEDEEIEIEPWHVNRHKLKQVSDQITELANHHARNRGHSSLDHLRCWVTYSKSKTYKKSWYSVYVNGVLQKPTFHQIPRPPSHLRVCSMAAGQSKEIKGPSLRLNWKYYNRGFPTKFLIRYRIKDEKNSNSWSQKGTDETLDTTFQQDFEQQQRGTVMEFCVAALTCFGLSDFSQIVCTKDEPVGDVRKRKSCLEDSSSDEDSRSTNSTSSEDTSYTSEAQHTQSTRTISPAKQQKTDLHPPIYLKVKSITENSATLEWNFPSSNNITFPFVYRVRLWKKGQLKEFDFTSNKNDCKLILLPKTTHYFQVVAISEGQSISEPSQIITGTTLAPLRFAEILVKQCKKISQSNGVDQFAISLTKSTGLLTQGIYPNAFLRYVFGQTGHAKKEPWRTILLLGDSGSTCKKTLINSMVNYVFNVQLEDTFRFQLIDKEDTNFMTDLRVYEINHAEGFLIPYSLRIISVPNFGISNNTLDLDLMITKFVRSVIEHMKEIQELDMIGVIVNASQQSLGVSQTTFLNSIFSLFGRDLQENIRFLLTNADRVQVPPILNAIKTAKLPCLTENGQLLHHKLMSLPTNDISFESLEDFFISLNAVKTTSLTLTRRMLNIRKCLVPLEAELLSLSKTNMTKTCEIMKLEKTIAKIQERITDNPYVILEVDAAQKFNLPVGLLATNCIKCSMTCYNPCLIKSEIDGTPSAPGTRHCSICPGKCSWRIHSNQTFKWDIVKERRRCFPTENDKKKYDAEMEKKVAAEKNLHSLKKELKENEENVVKQREKIVNSLLELESISLSNME